MTGLETDPTQTMPILEEGVSRRRLAQSAALRLVRATGVKRFQVPANLGAPSCAPITPRLCGDGLKSN
jgi:hypothetical protein